jgi:hypothetical protein
MTTPILRRIRSLVPSLVAVLLAGGCASPSYDVKVDAITRPVVADVQSYQLKSKNPALGEENLRYKEAADFVRTALSGKGLYEAPDPDAADIVVEVDFGMEAPRTKIERVSVPVYAQVGGGVRYDTVPVVDARGNTSFRTVAVYQPPRSELIGYDKSPRHVTIYEKYLRITARENKPASEGRPPNELWSVTATAEDESKDLRKYLPIMAAATGDYIGRDTGQQAVVRVKGDAEGVDFIRRGMSEEPVARNSPAR